MPQENYAAKQQRIGERLTRAMAKAHMNRNELAELTGYSVEQIVSWERGRARMYPIELVKLCHALDVKPEWLLCWERRLHRSASVDPDERSDIRGCGSCPHIAEPVIGRAFARPVGSSGLHSLSPELNSA